MLASFVAPEVEFRSAQQSYYTGLEAFYRMAVTQPQPQPQSQSHASVRGAEAIDRMADELRTMGVSNSQLQGDGPVAASSCRTSAWSRRWTASC